MDNEIEREEGGITLGQIFRTIFSEKWLALIIAAAITIVGTLGLYFTGKRNEVYSVSFVLQLPNTGDASSTSYTYPDGESFYFTDLISPENLKAVASRDGFKDINVDKMVKEGDISIVRTVDKVDDDAKDGVYDLNYTIKVKSKYFEDDDEARDFIEALTAFPREHISSMDIDYDQSLTTSKSAITYEEQLILLNNQATYIQSKYNELIIAHGREFVINGGKTLAQYKDEIDAYISKDLFTSLKALADKYGYVKSSEAEYKYRGDLEAIDQALTRATATREELLKFADRGSVIYDEIILISREIATLTQQKEFISAYINSCENAIEAPQDFRDEVKNIEDMVTEFTEGIKPVASYVYGKVTKINYLSTKVIEVEGGFGILLSAVIGLVAGLVIAAIAAYVVGWNKQKKAAVGGNANVPVYGEAQLQAAVTEDTEDENKKDDK